MPGTGIRHSRASRHASGHPHSFSNYLTGAGGTFARNDLVDWAVRVYPITTEVRDAIIARYDGDNGSARDIGQCFRSPVPGDHDPFYPSWHITAIAKALGLLDERQRARIRKEHGKRQDDTDAPRWAWPSSLPPTPAPTTPAPPPTPVEPPLDLDERHAPTDAASPDIEPVEQEEDTSPVSQFATLPERSPDQPEPDETPTPAPDEVPSTPGETPAAPAPAMLTCRDCKQAFAPWKLARSGVLCRTATCRDCFSAMMSATARRIGTKPPPYGSRGNPRRESDKPTAPLAAEKWEAKPAPEPPVTPAPEERPALRIPFGWHDTSSSKAGGLTFYPGANASASTVPTGVTINPAAFAKALLPPAKPDHNEALRAPLHTLVDRAPVGGEWSDSERLTWLEALTGWLDFAIKRKADAQMWRAGSGQ